MKEGIFKMKTLEIMKMTTKEFEKELSQSNWEFAKEKYITISNALEVYQDGARLSNEEEYLNVNEYFDNHFSVILVNYY